MQKQLIVDPPAALSADLKDFPMLVHVVHADLAGAGGEEAFAFFGEDDAPLDSEIVEYDAGAGELWAWVRLPVLSATKPTRLRVSDTGAHGEPANVWDDDYRLVIHDPVDPVDSTRSPSEATPEENTDATARIKHDDSLAISDAITVEAWAGSLAGQAEAMQSLVSKWRATRVMGDLAAVDASRTGDMDTTGYLGAVFDGRYIYFSPQHDRKGRHGKVLRLDTHGDFKDPASWSAYNAARTSGLETVGYYGAVFDGRYVIFPPRFDGHNYHSRVLRYDTQGAFDDPKSWDAYDAGAPHSSQSAAFDGRYVYFCPGQYSEMMTRAEEADEESGPKPPGLRPDHRVLYSGDIMRYDTQGDFHSRDSWTNYNASETNRLDTRDFDGAVYDGRHVYFAPLTFGAPLRYDTQGEFHDERSWSAYDGTRLGMSRCVGAMFDGRYVYFVPYGESDVVARYDTRGDFTDDRQWEAYQLSRTSGLNVTGYDGAMFDGRYVYFVPFWDEAKSFHAFLLRYDTTREFSAAQSWEVVDAGSVDGLHTIGYNAGATDGRFLYLAPWHDGKAYPDGIIAHGRVLRVDTTGDNASFDLRFCDVGHNGGLNAAVPGARFLVNTESGALSVAANQSPRVGNHHLAGVYDGKSVKLYIDGELVNEETLDGDDTPHDRRLLVNRSAVTIGRMTDGGALFNGSIAEVRISARARSAEWLATQHANMTDPDGFCRIED